jgi:cardiolipin synthase
MEEMYLQDLTNATEIVLDEKHKVRAPGEPRHSRHAHKVMTSGGGSVGRAASGAVRFGNTLGAAFTNRRVLEPVEARLMAGGGTLLLILTALFALFPRVLVYPMSIVFAWFGVALLYRSYRLHREGKRKKGAARERAAARRVPKEKVD